MRGEGRRCRALRAAPSADVCKASSQQLEWQHHGQPSKFSFQHQVYNQRCAESSITGLSPRRQPATCLVAVVSTHISFDQVLTAPLSSKDPPFDMLPDPTLRTVAQWLHTMEPLQPAVSLWPMRHFMATCIVRHSVSQQLSGVRAVC